VAVFAVDVGHRGVLPTGRSIKRGYDSYTTDDSALRIGYGQEGR
jgi:hypothetical protein